MKLTIQIDDEQKDTRLDTLISSNVQSCSRTRAARLINTSCIIVNNQKKKPGFRVKSGDIVTGIIPDSNNNDLVMPEDIPLDIFFEDDHIMIINKKPGMVVHPAPGNLSGTLVNAVLSHDSKIMQVGKDPLRAGIVHRLDKDTSGLIIVAKTRQALYFLQNEFKQRRVVKKYLALVSGNMTDDHGEINLPIGRHPVKRKIMAVNHENGKPAITCFKILERFKTGCFVEVLLKTGRTHQIRVHFYAIDHPLIGDKVYQYRQYRRKNNDVPRQMLHAWQLSFRHPYSGQKISFKADPPSDFLHFIKEYRSKRIPIKV